MGELQYEQYRMTASVVITLLLLGGVNCQWPTLCKTSGSFSAWNETRCPAGATCTPNGFSASGMGCCPWPNAVACASGYMCCPEGTVCVPISGSGYSTTYNCSAASTTVTTSKCPCKPGPPLPPSSSLKNILVIGDSISIGYVPSLVSAFASVALVQHAPWDFVDGGAEETAYGLQCLEYWLHSPSGIAFNADLVLFNFGMHDLVLNCTPGFGCTPGQSGNSTVYPGELQQITAQLQAYAAKVGAKLLFANTSPMLCDAGQNAVIPNTLNPAAISIMARAGIPTIDMYGTIVEKCGPVPQASCFGTQGCWCPHCPPGYAWLAQTAIIPAIQKLLF